MLADLFNTWRSEIELDLVQAQAELVVAEAALADAEIARNEARARARKMAAEIDKLTPERSVFLARYTSPIASALQVRVHDFQRTAASAEGPVAIAKSQISALREQVADYELALRQIDMIINPPQDADAAADDEVQAEAA